MKIIGLTGTSGSGKSTVCAMLEDKYKAEIIDADKVAKELSKKGTLYLQSIVESFGDDIVTKQGELNRKKLANLIYADDTKREELNKLTFIYVIDEIKKRITLVRSNIIVIDAPLLFESNLNQICDFVIGVIAQEDIKIQRICQRDEITVEDAKKRLNAQQSNEFLIESCDIIIENNGDFNKLDREIEKLKI